MKEDKVKYVPDIDMIIWNIEKQIDCITSDYELQSAWLYDSLQRAKRIKELSLIGESEIDTGSEIKEADIPEGNQKMANYAAAKARFVKNFVTSLGDE